MEQYTIKSVAFGGFDKEDVARYIEQISQETGKLREERDALREQAESAAQEVEALREQVQQLTAAKAQLETEVQRLASAEEENADLRSQLETLRPDAEAYAQFRERIGAIECEARKRAADLEAASQAQMRRTVETFRAQYQALMHTFNSTAAHVTGELRKVEVNLTQLPRAMDQASVELKELEKLLEQNSGQNG